MLDEFCVSYCSIGGPIGSRFTPASFTVLRRTRGWALVSSCRLHFTDSQSIIVMGETASNSRKGSLKCSLLRLERERYAYFLAPVSFWHFVQAEFTRDYMLECEEQKYLEKRERIYNFLLMSSSLEKVNARSNRHAKDSFCNSVFAFI